MGMQNSCGRKLKGSMAVFRLTALFMFSLVGCIAQPYTVFHYSSAGDMPSSEVYDIHADRRGFLWFATDNGVVRYDGSEFESFHVRQGLTDPVVFGFYEDDRGYVWFRTFSGRLSYYDGQEVRPYRYNQQLVEGREYGFLNFVYDPRSEALWFTLAHYFGKIDREGFIEYFPVQRPSFIIKSIGGKLLQGNDLKYAVKNIIINDQLFPVQLSDTTERKFFNSVQCDDRIYISAYKDLFEYEGGTLRRIFSSDVPIISLSKDREENLWVGYLNHGVERFGASGRWSPSFLKDKSVTRVYQDNSSGFWFATLESGVYFVPNFQIRNYSLPSSSRVQTVLATGDTVLVGDQLGNLFFIDALSGQLLSQKKYEGEVYALFKDSAGNIWVSAGMETFRYNASFRLLNVYNKLAITSFDEGPSGTVWAYGGIRITRFDETGKILSSTARYTNYRAMLIDDTVVYFAGRTGLHVRNKQMELLHSPEVLTESKITRLQSINDTTLALATQGNGLFLVNPLTWAYRHFDTEHQFIANNVYDLAHVDSMLWIATGHGLVGVNTHSILHDSPEFFHVSHRTGLVSNQIEFVLPLNETIWAFAETRFSVIPKAQLNLTRAQPLFYLKQMVTGKDTLRSFAEAMTGNLRLPYEGNHLTLRFGYVSFSNQSVLMRYRIQQESDWTLTADRTLQFLSLAPGAYRFELQFSQDNIHWIPAFQSISFSVAPPWWLRWYTIAGALLTSALAVYLYFRYRQSIYRQRNHYLSIINSHQQKLIQSEIETLERERHRIARELHDGVGTNLTAIKLMVNQLLQNHREPLAAEVEEQFQIALRELKDIIYGLTPPALGRYGLFTALENYVSKLNKSLAPSITLQVFGNEIRHYDFNIMVFRIIQELISNSIKHSSARNITIHVNSFEDVLNVVYEDDGVGFSNTTAEAGLGLDNIESRIRSMNGTLTFSSGQHGVSYTIDLPLDCVKAHT